VRFAISVRKGEANTVPEQLPTRTLAVRGFVYLRHAGLAQTDEEARDEENERVTHRLRPEALYPC